MTKDQEIRAFWEFYNGLPEDSYLKEILKGVPEHAEESNQTITQIVLKGVSVVMSNWDNGEAERTIRSQAERIRALQAELAGKVEHVAALREVLQSYQKPTGKPFAISHSVKRIEV